MIDIKTELRDYKKINLEEIEASGQQLNDETRNSIVLYNKAVESLSNGSEDIAIIELKKAVSINPHFYEALNLLGICYGYINEPEKAADAFGKVMKGESNGVRAQRYLGQLKSPEQVSAKTKPVKRSSGTNSGNTGSNTAGSIAAANAASTAGAAGTANPVSGGGAVLSRRTAAKSKARFKLPDMFKYIAGFAAGAVLIGAISLLPHRPESKQPDASAAANNSNVQTQQTDDYKARFEELDKNYKLLQKDAVKSAGMIEYYKNVIKLYDAESLAAGKQLESAADLLLQLKAVDYTGADSDKFRKLNSSILPKAAQLVYEDGVMLFNSRKYNESVKKLEKVPLYDPAFKRNDSALYYMGKCYQELNDSRNAIAAYQKLINTYPLSTQAKYAKSKIERLTGQP